VEVIAAILFWPLFQISILLLFSCLCRRDVVSFQRFRFWKQVIFDMGGRKMQPIYWVEADRVIRGSQNLA